jgi:hypothetical protein
MLKMYLQPIAPFSGSQPPMWQSDMISSLPAVWHFFLDKAVWHAYHIIKLNM